LDLGSISAFREQEISRPRQKESFFVWSAVLYDSTARRKIERKDAEGNFTAKAAKATKRDFQSHIFAAFVAFVVKNDSFGVAREKSSRPQRFA
jgi:hypothetical protein